MKKRISFILLMLLVLSIILSACSAAGTNQNKPSKKEQSYRLTFVCPIINDEYWGECVDGVKQADKELGTTTTIVGSKTSKDFIQNSAEALQAAIDEKPDAIIACGGTESIDTLINKASAQGIPVITVESDSVDVSKVAFIGTDAYNAGKVAGEEMITLTGGEAKIGILISTSQAQKEMSIVSAFKDTISDYLMDIMDIVETDADKELAEKKALAMLKSNPDINVILATSSYSAIGAARAKKELGRDDLIILGFDDVDENINYVKQGVINALISQRIRQIGYQSVYLMKEYLDNGSLPKQSYDSGTFIINKDNIDSYKTQMEVIGTDTKTVRLGYYTGDASFQDGFDDTKRKSGYAYEYLQTIASIAGWKYEYHYGTRVDMLRQLEDGEIDVVAGVYKSNELRERVLFSRQDMKLDGIQRFFAISKDRPDLLEDIDYANEQITQSAPDYLPNLSRKYYSHTSLQVLTENEKKWLDRKCVLRFGYIANNLPLSDQDSDGNPNGVVKDLIEILSKYLRVTIKPLCYDSMESIELALKNNEIDAAFPIYSDLWLNETKELSQTDSIVDDRVMIVYKGDYSPTTMDNVALNRTGIGLKYFMETYYPKSNITYYNSRKEAFDSVQRGDEGCVIGCSSVLQQFLRINYRYQNLNVAYLDSSENFCIAVRQENNILLEILNKAVRHTDNATITSAVIKYSAIDSQYKLTTTVQRYSTLLIGLSTIFTLILIGLFAGYLRKAKAFNTEQTKAKVALEDALQEANAGSEAKTNFLSSMSHDIRTPMNAVIGMTAIAKRNIDSTEKVEECLEKIDLSSRHLLTLINNILDISKIESGQLQLNPIEFSIKESFDTLTEIVKPQVEAKNIDFSTTFESTDYDIVCADEVRVNQIFINLLTNAIKYTPDGGSVKMILKQSLSEDHKSTNITYIVSDTGIGMSKDFMENMYDIFTRASDSRINKIQGTGLGLAIVKQMVDMMDGTIDCESEENKGTTFTVMLELPVVHENKTPTDESSDSNESSASDIIISEKHLLIAEDNELNWEVIHEILDIYGISADRAVNGKNCVEMINASDDGEYDLILMDVQMPIMNGREASREIRRSDRDYVRNIPIIAMTADAFAEDIKACLDAGMNGHVSKPVDISKLFQEIARVMGG